MNLETQAADIIVEALVNYAFTKDDQEKTWIDGIVTQLEDSGCVTAAAAAVTRWVDLTSQRRAAEELAIHVQFYWDMAGAFEGTLELAEQAGEAAMALVLKAQVQWAREVSARLQRAVARMSPPDPAQILMIEKATKASPGPQEADPNA